MRRSISIIGAGRLGGSLGRLWHETGSLEIFDVLGRTEDAGAAGVAKIGAGRAITRFADLRRVDLFCISTPDAAISAVESELAGSGVLDASCTVFHCSGAESSLLLRESKTAGAAVASVHPVMSFSHSPVAADRFVGVVCAMEGEARALPILEEVFGALGGRTIRLDPDRKLLYHAAAVFGSNYLTTLVQLALETYRLAGIESDLALEMLAPLVSQTVENVLQAGPKAALTGPIARNDASLVRREYAALAAVDEELARLYRGLARPTARLAGRIDPLDPTPADRPFP
ncbi:MAG: Rossmann-like and DUF2520 domain-containing protein [Burkholderiaceae bacterium]|jgi:predicted short-subunit dehydrogenase-like oxidoreductase (DUF2520 family)